MGDGTKAARSARINLRLGVLATRIARTRVEVQTATAGERISAALDGLEDALDGLDAAILTAPPAMDSERAAAVVRRHVEAIGEVARSMAAGAPVQRAAVLRLAADVAHEGRRLTVAMAVGRGELRSKDVTP
jgi:hypothetical protein